MSVIFVPEEPIETAETPVAVYEIVVHDTSIVVIEGVMRDVVQTGVCDACVIDPEVPRGQPVSVIVSPPIANPKDHDVVLIGVELDSVKPHEVTFWAVEEAVVQTLLVQFENVSVEKATELTPSATVAVPVVTHETDTPATDDVIVPLNVILQVVPATHVTLADAGGVVVPRAVTTTALVSRMQ